MTEAKWLTCADASLLWRFLEREAREDRRKLRLLAVAFCRLSWHRLTDWRCQKAVEVAERHADTDASDEELIEAGEAIRGGGNYRITGAELARRVTAVTGYGAAYQTIFMAQALHTAEAQDLAGRVPAGTPISAAPVPAEAAAARCLFGPLLFRPVPFEAEWLTPTVVGLAEGIYEERAFDRLPILADALQDAGCEEADILNHCRGEGRHLKGCWVVDLALGIE
ncbi:hypothetical protein [Limnoglobus roseus]|uniref:SMI1/KNR4 family protein n=1 Tax=Limnoglobus roseus TaxID=2598579 RepID=A0A5C1ASM0_9BACT|nr:hypothetical protein [Limnoglobus roseus]QEL21093.1 SMI1/KNR4 family protein [Limnoglobus roseus]